MANKTETCSFSFTPGWKGWIEEQVRQGHFRSKSAVAEEALKLLKKKEDPNTPLSKFTS